MLRIATLFRAGLFAPGHLRRLTDAFLKTGAEPMTGALNHAPTATLASAATVEIGAAASNTIEITGTVAITALGSAPAGALRFVTFRGALTLTHNAASLILPTAASIPTSDGDNAVFRSLGSGNWRCIGYVRSDGTALVAPPASPPVTGSRTISAADSIVAADKGRVLNLNGTFTLGATAAATLGAGFYCYLRKTDGNGIVTFDPNAAETINGRSTILVYQEGFLLWTDGAAWFTQGRPKGWVAIASVVLTGQSLTSLDITSGFTDPEMLEVETVFSNLIASASATHRIAPMKAGAIVVTGNSVVELIQTSGTSISAISTTGAPSNTNLTPVATAGPITGKLRAPNTQSTLPADARLEFDAVQSGATRRAWVWDTGTNDSLSGVRFTVSTGNITSITYTVKGYRP